MSRQANVSNALRGYNMNIGGYRAYIVQRQILPTLLCVSSMLLSAGCYPVRTTSQPVHLRISNSTSGEPVAGVQVRLRYDYDRDIPDWRKWPPDDRWHFGITDNDGQVDVGIEYIVVDRTIGSKPPSWRDRVSGIPYLVVVRRNQLYEEFSLLMQPSISAQGEFFVVSVLKIQEPRYIRTE